MQPSLEDIQTALNKATQLVLDISKGVYQWGQDREKQHGRQDREKQHGTVIHHESRRNSHTTLHGFGQGGS